MEKEVIGENKEKRSNSAGEGVSMAVERQLLASGYTNGEICEAARNSGDTSAAGIASYLEAAKRCREEASERKKKEGALEAKRQAEKGQQTSYIEQMKRQREEDDEYLKHLRQLIREDMQHEYVDIESKTSASGVIASSVVGGSGLMPLGTPLKSDRPPMGQEDLLLKIVYEGSSVRAVFKRTDSLDDLREFIKREFKLKSYKIYSVCNKGEIGVLAKPADTLEGNGISNMDTLYLSRI